jgi:hypothetical protein
MNDILSEKINYRRQRIGIWLSRKIKRSSKVMFQAVCDIKLHR